MESKYHQHDIITIEAKVEIVQANSVQAIVTGPTGESRVQVNLDAIKTHSPGPLRAGERVTFNATEAKKTVTKTGVVRHVYDNQAWIEAGGNHTIQNIEALSRV